MGVENIHPVCSTNFDVADQLADVGMEAIHPKASKPLEINNIPIRIKNAFDPDHAGTLITKDFIAPKSMVEIVTGSDKVTCMEVHDTRMVGEVGFDLRILQVLAKHDISYISKATNANTIGMIIGDRDCRPDMIAELQNRFEQITLQKVAIVCAIGSNIGQPGIMAKAAGALAADGINILAVSQTARQTNMQFVVERGQFAKAQVALHAALCTTMPRTCAG
jgi:aspartate kinase